MAIFTTKNRVYTAVNFKASDSLYLAIGRTTPWPDEYNPPTPLVSQTEVDELVYIKKIQVRHMVRLDSPYDAYGVDVEVGDYSYNYLTDAQAFNEDAYRLYLSETIFYDDIAPTNTTFRQIGILLNPTDAYGSVLTGAEYLAASVNDQGELLYINNVQAVTRTPEQSEKFEFILVF